MLYSYVQCHVFLLVYTIMYMLYSSDLIICTVSCIPTGIYNTVHAFSSDLIICKVSSIPTSIYNNVHVLFFSPYHMYIVLYSYWYIQSYTCFILLTFPYVQCHVYLLVYTIVYMLFFF